MAEPVTGKARHRGPRKAGSPALGYEPRHRVPVKFREVLAEARTLEAARLKAREQETRRDTHE